MTVIHDLVSRVFDAIETCVINWIMLDRGKHISIYATDLEKLAASLACNQT